MRSLHPSHAANRYRAIQDMTVLLWAGLDDDDRRDPLVPLRLAEWPQVMRTQLGRAAGHYDHAHPDSETWAEVVGRVHGLIQAELRIRFLCGPLVCPTCEGERSVEHGIRHIGHYEGPVADVWDEDCPDCFDGFVPCQNCGERRAVLEIDGVSSCEGCRDVVSRLVVLDSVDVSPAELVDSRERVSA